MPRSTAGSASTSDGPQRTVAESAAMLRAIELASRGLGRTGTNPVVGAVVLNAAGVIVGEGFHGESGVDHAEVIALARAGDRAWGGTVMVTLEPCAHTGRTPPCIDAVMAAGVARLRYAIADPTRLAAGGARMLRAAGLEVLEGPCSEDAAQVNEAWLTGVRLGRPLVTWKFASTLDGRSAATDGSSRWITGLQSRRDVHRLRAEVDAVLIGTGTALADDPSLTVRDDAGALESRQPLRVVLGDRKVPAGAALRDDAAQTLFLSGHDAAAALATLYDRGVRHVLLEGGATLAAAMVRAGLVDRVVAYLAPVLLGGGRSIVGDLGVGTIADALRLHPVDVRTLGVDVRVTARPSASVTTDTAREV